MNYGQVNTKFRSVTGQRKRDASTSILKKLTSFSLWSNQIRKVIAFILVVGLTLPIAPYQAIAAVTTISRELPLSARLASSSTGFPVPDGEYSITFSIYTALTGGTAVWSEKQTVTATNGIFSARLGSVTALPDSLNFNGSDYYLGIFVSGEAGEMSPRRKIGAVPTAVNADTVGGASAGTGANNVLKLNGSGNIDIAGGASLGGTLAVTGASTLSSTLVVSGATTLSSTLAVTGASTLSGTLAVTGAATLASTLAVTGAATLSSTLAVSGNATFDTTTFFVDASNNRVGVGTASPSVLVHTIGTSEQLRLGYDTTNYVSFTVNSSGDLTINPTGGDTTITGTLTASSTSSLSGPVTITSTTSPQLSVRYDGSNYFSAAVSSTGGVTYDAVGTGAAFSFSDALTANTFVSSGATLTGGTINSMTIGATTPSTGAFTTLSSTIGTSLATSSGNVALGNATGTFAVTSTGLNVSTGGALTGVTGITTSGAYTQSGTGANTLSGATSINGNTTLGDASTDTVTVNSAAWTFANDTTVALTGGLDGLNFDSNTLSIDAANDRIGILDASPAAALTVGSGDLFQVNSSGAIAAVVGITSSSNYVQSTGNMQLTTNVSTGTGSTAGLYVLANSLTTGRGVDASSTSITSGSLASLALSGSSAYTGNVLAVTTTNTGGTGSASSYGINVARSGANSNTAHTAYGIYSTVTNTNATSGTNIAAYLSASGATTANYGLLVAAGDVGIGDTTPDYLLDVAGTFGVDGNITLGDASTDTVTVNSAAWTFANDTTVALTGGVNGLNFDSNTLSIDATGNNIGLGTATPAAILNISGAKSASSWTTTGLQLAVDAATLTDTSSAAAATVASRTATSLGQPTYASTNAITVTDAATLYIANAPAAGTNTTVTNAYALWVDNGAVKLDGALTVGGATTFTGAQTITTTTSPQLTVGYDASNYFTTAVSSAGAVTIDATGASSAFTFSDAVSIPGTGSGSLRLGASSLAGGTNSVAIGTSASASAASSVAIGASAAPSDANQGESVAIGNSAVGTYRGVSIGTSASGIVGIGYGAVGFTGIAIGQSASALNNGNAPIVIGNSATPSASGNSNIVIGHSASYTGDNNISIGMATTNGNNGSIVLGYGATSTAANQLIIGATGSTPGGGTNSVTAGFIGNGVTNAAPAAFTLNATGGSGTNIAGANLVLAGGRGTGTGAGGSLLFQTAAAGSTGTSLNSLSTRLTINSAGLLTVAGSADGTDALALTAGDILVTDGDLDLSGGDFNVVLDAGDGASIVNNGLTNNTAFTASSTSTAGTASDSSYVAQFTRSGANSNTAHTAYGVYSTVTNTNATSGTNIAGYFSASGATTANYGLIVNAGSVGIGDTTPDYLLDVAGTFGVDGNITLGDASTDTVTVNSAAWTFANDTTVALTGGLDGLNFDSNTLSIDAANDRVGILDASPAAALTVGSGDLFQVNSSGAIAAVVGITSSSNYVQSTGNMQLTTNVSTGTGTTAGLYVVANSLTTGYGLDASSTSITSGSLASLAVSGSSAYTGNVLAVTTTNTGGTASASSYGINVARSGANSNTAHTAYGVYSTVTNTNATSGTNIAGYFSASGATTANYGLIVAAGNVGIGTTTPNKKLNVYADSATTTGVVGIEQANASGDASLYFLHTATRVWAVGIDRSDDNKFKISNDNANGDVGVDTRLTIDNTGNVGIGDSTPDYFLDVAGTFGVDGNITLGDASTDTVTANSAAWTFANDTTVALTGGVNGLNFDSDTLSIDAANNSVGIGTSSVIGKLNVKGAGGIVIEQTSNAASMLFFRNESASTPWQVYLVTNDLRWYDTDDRFTLEYGGNIGIGTNNPATRLHVVEGTVGNEVLRLESVATNDDPNYRVFQQRAATTDATQTTLLTIATASDQVYLVEARIVARCTAGAGCTAGDAGTYVIRATYRNVGGTLTEVNETADYTAEDQAGWAPDLAVSSTNILVRVTGEANDTVTWHVTATVQNVGS